MHNSKDYAACAREPPSWGARACVSLLTEGQGNPTQELHPVFTDLINKLSNQCRG